MLNETREKKQQPEQWKSMRIKSTPKKAIKRMEMKYQRGLFLTNVLSKSMERILLNRSKSNVDRSMQPFQNGGVNNRSISDVLFIVNNAVAPSQAVPHLSMRICGPGYHCDKKIVACVLFST